MKALILFVIQFASALFEGFVFTLLWKWFVVSTFGVAALPFVAALGLIQLVHFLTWQADVAATERPDYVNEQATIQILKPLLFLVSGFVIHLFM